MLHNLKPKTLIRLYFVLLTTKCLLMIYEMGFGVITIEVAFREILSAFTLLVVVAFLFSKNKHDSK